MTSKTTAMLILWTYLNSTATSTLEGATPAKEFVEGTALLRPMTNGKPQIFWGNADSHVPTITAKKRWRIEAETEMALRATEVAEANHSWQGLVGVESQCALSLPVLGVLFRVKTKQDGKRRREMESRTKALNHTRWLTEGYVELIGSDSVF